MKKIKYGKVSFLTPVPYASLSQKKGTDLVIVSLEQLVKAQREFDKTYVKYFILGWFTAIVGAILGTIIAIILRV
jgi:hypothetical protein